MGKKTISGLVVALFLVAMGVSAAEHRDHSAGFHGFGGKSGFGDPDRMVEMMSRFLELDELQTESIRNTLSAAQPEIDELRSRARANRAAIAALDPSDKDYGARLSNLAEENGYLATQATELHGRVRAEISAQLTPEQRLELAERSSRMKERFRDHRRHGKRDSDTQ
jgi:Spy/CpxP family protein refolding chaperone